jgi:hypothetical protein
MATVDRHVDRGAGGWLHPAAITTGVRPGARRVDRACLAIPILPGRTGTARAFLRALETDRKSDHARAGQRLGLTKALWFLVDGIGGAQVVVYLEGADIALVLDGIVRSRDPFDRWFKAELAEATGLDLNDPPEGLRPPELLASFAIDEPAGQA